MPRTTKPCLRDWHPVPRMIRKDFDSSRLCVHRGGELERLVLKRSLKDINRSVQLAGMRIQPEELDGW